MEQFAKQPIQSRWRTFGIITSRLALLGLPLLVYSLLWLSRAGNAPFWSDEILSFFMCGKPQVPLGTVWHGIWQGRDGMFPAFYLIHYFWGATLQPLAAQLLSSIASYPQEAAWRLPSLLITLGGAVMLHWQLAARYGFSIAVAAISVLLLGSNQIYLHGGGFRCYGMLLGFSALLLALLLARDKRMAPWQLPALALCALLLTFSHLFGILYVAVLALAYLLAGYRELSRWLTTVVTVVPAGLLLLAYLPAILNLRQLEAPWSWRAPPSLEMLPDGYLMIGLNPWLPIILAIIGAVAVIGKTSCQLSSDQPSVAVWSACTLLAVPPLIWLLSQLAMPVFLNRYFLPVALAYGVLTAAILPLLGGRLSAVILVVLLGLAGLAGIPQPSSAPPSAMQPLYPLSRGQWQPPAVFHVTDSSHLFMQQLFYESNSAVRHFFIYDKELAYNPAGDAPRRLASEINQVEAQAKNWQDSGSINGVPEDLLLPVAESADFARYLPATRQLVVSRSLDLKTGEYFNQLLLSMGWQPATRYMLPPPAGSIDSGIERTVWRKGQAPAQSNGSSPPDSIPSRQ